MTINSGLWNRASIKGYKQHKLCQVCKKAGQNNKLNEIHLLFECAPLQPAHTKYGTKVYKQKYPCESPEKVYKKYWSDTDTWTNKVGGYNKNHLPKLSKEDTQQKLKKPNNFFVGLLLVWYRAMGSTIVPNYKTNSRKRTLNRRPPHGRLV